MTRDVDRYVFGDAIPAEEVEATFVLSIFAVEALHGESQTRLDAAHATCSHRPPARSAGAGG